MIKNSEKILRELLAVIVSSRLTANEMRDLATLLASDQRFSHRLASLVEDLSYRLSAQGEFDWQEPAASDDFSGGLTDLAYKIVQRKRLSKSKLMDMFKSAGAVNRNSKLSKDLPVRDLIEYFLSTATSSQVDQFMSYLGVELGRDAYLSGIDPANRR